MEDVRVGEYSFFADINKGIDSIEILPLEPTSETGDGCKLSPGLNGRLRSKLSLFCRDFYFRHQKSHKTFIGTISQFAIPNFRNSS